MPGAGVVLVAHPMATGDFARSVVLLCAHGPTSGAVGLVLNRPVECTLAQLPAERDARRRAARLQRAGAAGDEGAAQLMHVVRLISGLRGSGCWQVRRLPLSQHCARKSGRCAVKWARRTLGALQCTWLLEARVCQLRASSACFPSPPQALSAVVDCASPVSMPSRIATAQYMGVLKVGKQHFRRTFLSRGRKGWQDDITQPVILSGAEGTPVI